MFAVIALFIGAVFGWVRAARRGGSTADRAQYAVGHGLGFGLAAMAAGIALHWSGLFSGF